MGIASSGGRGASGGGAGQGRLLPPGPGFLLKGSLASSGGGRNLPVSWNDLDEDERHGSRVLPATLGEMEKWRNGEMAGRPPVFVIRALGSSGTDRTPAARPPCRSSADLVLVFHRADILKGELDGQMGSAESRRG